MHYIRRMMRTLLILLGLGAGLYAGPAAAFCVQNDGSVPVTIHAGGQPMPTYVKPNLRPGERDCHVPRKPEGITVEIFDSTNQRLRCRLSVPAKDATITVGQTCKVKLD
jgi:hypothetical protein